MAELLFSERAKFGLIWYESSCPTKVFDHSHTFLHSQWNGMTPDLGKMGMNKHELLLFRRKFEGIFGQYISIPKMGK